MAKPRKKPVKRTAAKNSGPRSQTDERTIGSLKVTRMQGFNLFDEVVYIVQSALEGLSRVVVLNRLVLFSTVSGDAWLLDTEDNFAMCLLSGLKPQMTRIAETPTSYAIDWQMQYAFDNDRFVVTDDRGQNAVFDGYPIAEIQQLISATL